MAKKKTNDNSEFTDLAKTIGGITLDTAGDVPYFIDTGSLALNYICSGKFMGGGIPGGRITEVYGPPATSKSLLGYCCLASCQRTNGVGALLDCERAASAGFAASAGHLDPTRLIVYEPVSIQQVESKLVAATKGIRQHFGAEKPILFVWDSITVTPTEREWKEIDLPENPTAAQIKAVGVERPGERARAAGDLFRKINPFLNENNATLFIINQTRKAIGVLYGNPNTQGGGGEAIKFYASCRLETAIGKTIADKSGMPLGVNLRFTNKKSRSFTPGLKIEGIQLFFEQGINPISGLLSLMLMAKRIEATNTKGGYRVRDEYADGKEIAFKANKELNQIPLEVLYQAPKLLDAKDEAELRDYFAMFEGAIRLATGDSIVERVVADNDEEPDFIGELKE